MEEVNGIQNIVIPILVAAIVLSFVVGYMIRKAVDAVRVKAAHDEAHRIIEEARKSAEGVKREALIEAKEEAHRLRTELERETRDRRGELQRIERRLVQKEEALERKGDNLEKREEQLNRRERELDRTAQEIQELKNRQVAELERISGMTTEDAKKLLLAAVEEETRREAANIIREIEAEAKEEGERRAREIIALAIQRCAAEHVTESTVSVVELPNDEMKGRIIGREGRNIRTLETLTGIDLIIDDTPEAVILSGFDPIRREVARLALQRLVADGRIHPARIEEMVEKAQKDVENLIREEGEQACFEANVHGLHPELVQLLGRLKFRTSYGQNVLRHSIEVAHLAGTIAAELGLNTRVARRAGLLHDIGKAVDHEVEGSHVAIGIDLLRRYKESEDIINAMASHHGDAEPRSLEAVLVSAADAISAARPGARRETLEAYIKRLQKLEEIAGSFDGVEKAYAIQAGREIRIMVKPEKVDDLGATKMANDIVKRVERELDYPGQIKVTVIRETRAVDYAK